MKNEFKTDKKWQGDRLILSFQGDIDENAEFSKIDLTGVKKATFDFSGIRFVNSIGLRGWLLWIRKASGMELQFVKCPRNVVDQMNILEGFLPSNALVESFYIPYYCSGCDHTEMHLVHRGKDYKEGTADAKEGILVQDGFACPKCGAVAELDVLKERYFNFLKYRK
ncbi:MAG: hypothetical protein IPL83_15000 [Bdellovibrionales bacterium]|nr:hypothetical protein [Bdellovibrionales bacterium]